MVGVETQIEDGFFRTWSCEIWWVERERAHDEDDDAATRVRLKWADSDGGLGPLTWHGPHVWTIATARMSARWA